MTPILISEPTKKALDRYVFMHKEKIEEAGNISYYDEAVKLLFHDLYNISKISKDYIEKTIERGVFV